MQNVDIEAPKMNQEELEEYLTFVAKRNQTAQQSNRKMSQQYFEEEARRLDAKLQAGVRKTKKKKFTCFNQLNSQASDIVETYGFKDRIEVRPQTKDEGFVLD